MLKKISAHQLVVGMYVNRLCGSWLDHPFWKKTFLVTEGKQIGLILGSGIVEVWIDTDRGLDVAAGPDTDDADDSALETMIATMHIASEAPPEPMPCSLEDELERAGRIVAQGRSAMRAMFQDARLGKALDPDECLPLVQDITDSIDRNPSAIVSLARLKTSDDYTYMHSIAVCALMVALSRKLELSDENTRDAGLAGLVHDIGKAAMPIEILLKPGPLTAEEFAVMKGHPAAGHAMLVEANGVGPGALDVCLHHHEKVDGRGYPHGLRGEHISLLARMGAVCDVYDAITSNRPYKAGWSPALSIQKMAQWSRDGHFDDAVLQAFIKSIGIYPIGSLVRLASGRIAVVVDQSAGGLLTPVVRTILDATSGQPCAAERIDLSERGDDDRIVSRETAEAWNLSDVDDHWRSPAPILEPSTGR